MKAKKPLTAITLLALLAECGVQDPQYSSSESMISHPQPSHFAADTELLWQYAMSPPGVPPEMVISPTYAFPRSSDRTIDTLLKVKDGAKESLFFTSDEAQAYLNYNGTLDDAHLYAEVITMAGNPIKRTAKGGLSLFTSQNGRLEEALSLLAVAVPINGITDSVFQTWDDLALYKFVGGTAEYATQLASIRNNDGTAPFSSAQDYVYAAYVKADIKTLRALHELKNNNDAEIFTRAYDMLAVSSNYTNASLRITPDKIEQLRKIKTPSGTPLFTTVDDFFNAAGTAVSYNELQTLASLLNDAGEPLFTTGADAAQYALTKKGDDYLQKLLKVKNKEGTQIFTDGAYVAAYAAMNGTVEAAQELADWTDEKQSSVLLAHEVIRYAALGFTKKDVTPVNTEKPNALAFLPVSDYNQAFLNGTIQTHFRKLREKYDFRLEFIAEDTAPEQKYQTLQNYPLLILGGHGDGQRVTLGATGFESAYFDQTDEGFCKLLDTLPSDAHIFIFSCYAGIGGPSGNNFANYVATCSPGRSVISSMTPMSAGDITIQTEYPLIAEINTSNRYPYNMDPRQNKEEKTNATYTALKTRTASASDSAQAPLAAVVEIH